MLNIIFLQSLMGQKLLHFLLMKKSIFILLKIRFIILKMIILSLIHYRIIIPFLILKRYISMKMAISIRQITFFFMISIRKENLFFIQEMETIILKSRGFTLITSLFSFQIYIFCLIVLLSLYTLNRKQMLSLHDQYENYLNKQEEKEKNICIENGLEDIIRHLQ